MNWAVIMAGGSGTRFWPASRKKFPKQFLPLVSEKSLLEETFERAQKIAHKQNILIFTSQDKTALVRSMLKLPSSQVIGEPCGRNTAPCAIWAAGIICRKDPKGILSLLPADHHIGKPKVFVAAMKAAYRAAHVSGMPVTLGLKPKGPHTGYGYLERRDAYEKIGSYSIFKLKRFLEKPKLAAAKRFVASKKYFWNAGIFVWSASRLLEAAKRYQPEAFRMTQKIGPKNKPTKLFFSKIPAISIDYGLMEHLGGNILTLPVDMDWNDVGSWASLADLRKGAGSLAKRTIEIDSRNNYVSSEKLVALLGVRDLVVVETGDAILVCSKKESESVRKVVDALQKKNLRSYL